MEQTHKILFLNKETLEVEDMLNVSSPDVVSTKEIVYKDGRLNGIQKRFYIVESSFDEKKTKITPEMVAEFNKTITMSHLDKKYKEAQLTLMANCEDFDEFSFKETALKKKYFDLKKEVMTTDDCLDLKIVF